MTTRARILLPTLLLLSACGGGANFDTNPVENYQKVGVSKAERKADLQYCESTWQTSGGAVSKNSYLQRTRTISCLKKRGYTIQAPQQPASDPEGPQ